MSPAGNTGDKDAAEIERGDKKEKHVKVVRKKRKLGKSYCDKLCRICRKPCETPLHPEEIC